MGWELTYNYSNEYLHFDSFTVKGVESMGLPWVPWLLFLITWPLVCFFFFYMYDLLRCLKFSLYILWCHFDVLFLQIWIICVFHNLLSTLNTTSRSATKDKCLQWYLKCAFMARQLAYFILTPGFSNTLGDYGHRKALTKRSTIRLITSLLSEDFKLH